MRSLGVSVVGEGDSAIAISGGTVVEKRHNYAISNHELRFSWADAEQMDAEKKPTHTVVRLPIHDQAWLPMHRRSPIASRALLAR